MIPQAFGVAALIRKLREENPGADDDYAKLIAEIDRLSDRCYELADAKDALEHVIVEVGVIPGCDYACRCADCRSVCVHLSDAGFLHQCKDRWWEKKT